MSRRMTIRVLAFTALAAIVFGTLTAYLGALGFAITIVFCALFVAYSRLYLIYGTPRRVRRAMLAEYDPDAGPPPDAQPTTSELFDRMHVAANAADWKALRALLAEDFTVPDPKGHKIGASGYIRTLVLLRRAFPDLRSETEAMLADPADPHVIWLRSRTLGHPRSGPPIDYTSWSRLTVTPDGQYAREFAQGGVIRVGESG